MSVVGGAREACEAPNWSRVQCVTLTTLSLAPTKAPSHC